MKKKVGGETEETRWWDAATKQRGRNITNGAKTQQATNCS